METNDRLNQLFNSAKKQPSKISFEETKARFLENTALNKTEPVHHNKFNFSSLKTILIMITTIVSVSIGILALYNSDTKNTENNNKNATIEVVEKPTIINEDLEKINRKEVNNLGVETFQREIISRSNNRLITLEKLPNTEGNTVLHYKEQYEFPVLTDEEIEAVKKQKRIMVKQLIKPNKDYVYIPSGTFKSSVGSVSVNAFYMKATEVTNLEYRTFLFDLLIQNRKEDFLLAKPKQEEWLSHGKWMQPMVDNYFSHAAYNNYPVNNITRKGAELFCKWLTQEVNKSPKAKSKINDLRLPYEVEWEYAASEAGKHLPYPWGGPYVRNAKGCFLANYMPGSDSIYNKQINDPKTMDDVYINDKNKNNLYSSDGGYFTVNVSSYHPNNYGLYCMSGNVAEMALNKDGKLISKGGGWNSKGYHLQISSSQELNENKADIATGFRPVITFIGENTKKDMNVFGMVEIKPGVYMDKTEISNFNWLEYVTWTKRIFGEDSEAYKQTLPDTTVWNALNSAYTNVYFSHPAYRKYPVVGISYDQVLAFCKWRSERIKEYYKKIGINVAELAFRLPTTEEFEFVASADFSDDDLKKMKDKSRFNIKRSRKELKEKNDNIVDITAPVESYYPNTLGIYNLKGNVAEMTSTKGIAKGGSWKHIEDECHFTNNLSFKSESNWLGFRCILEVSN